MTGHSLRTKAQNRIHQCMGTQMQESRCSLEPTLGRTSNLAGYWQLTGRHTESGDSLMC
jgi:hypothetical protein